MTDKIPTVTRTSGTLSLNNDDTPKRDVHDPHKVAVTGRGRESRHEKVEAQRPNRVSVAKQRDKLTVKHQLPGFVYRWVNDVKDGGRIDIFLNAGYQLVTDKKLMVGDRKMSDKSGEGSPIKMFVGNDSEGNKVYAYLMAIKKEWYDEDQLEKQRAIDEKEGRFTEGSDYGDIQLSDDTAY